MTFDTATAPALLAIAEIDVHTGAPHWVTNANECGHPIPETFEPESNDAIRAACWIWAMESSEYTAGLIWELIPYTAKALAEFAGRNAKYCKG